MTTQQHEKSPKTRSGTKKGSKNWGWIAFYITVILVWVLVFAVTLRSWILGTETLVDTIDLSLFTLPVLAFNLIFVSATFVVFFTYFGAYRKALKEQKKAIAKWNAVDSTQRGIESPDRWTADSGIVPGLCSIIIPARDEEQVIGNTIMACLDQTYTNIEVIIVCHNCSDKTYEEASKIPDRRVKPLDFRTKEAGKGIALNHGVAASRGEYVLILDADGRLTQNFVQDALPLFATGNYSAVQGRYVPSNREYNFITRMLSLEGDLWSTPFMTFRAMRTKRAGLGGTGYIVRRDALLDVGGFKNHLVDDYELTYRLLRKKHRIAFAPLCINYDEKPPTLDIMLKQRARWVKGFLSLMKSRVAEPSDFTGHLFWLNPLTAFTSLALLILAGFSTLHYMAFMYYPFQYSYIPLVPWIGLTIATFGIYTVALVMQYGRSGFKHAAWLPIYLPFANYYMVVALKAFWVTSWAETKTTHGFIANTSSRTQKTILEEKRD